MRNFLIVFAQTVGIIIVIALFIGFLFLLVKAAIDRQDWLDKHCKKIGEISGSTSFGINTGKGGGVVPVFTPGKTGYQCDDGMTYWE